jgi:uncharacterized protein YqjF (DUF2071 family)
MAGLLGLAASTDAPLLLCWTLAAWALWRALNAGPAGAWAAWVGVVPFRMDRIRPYCLPPVPWLSWFLELNVRTYVHDDEGNPGVWFHSLDTNRWPAYKIARTAFKLPYHHAAMQTSRGDITIWPVPSLPKKKRR